MSDQLKEQIKEVMVEELMLDMEPDEIGDTQPLMGPDSVGLDSVDALQLVVAIEKHFGLKIADAEVAKTVLVNVDTIAKAVSDQK